MAAASKPTRQEMEALAEVQPEKDARIQFRIKELPRERWGIGYTDPFSEDGQAIKAEIKRLGGAWDGLDKQWALSDDAVRILPFLLEARDNVNLTGLPHVGEPISPALARKVELFQAGITPVELVKVEEDAVLIKTPSKCEPLYQACRAIDGIRWQAAPVNAYRVPHEALISLVGRLDSEPSLDLSDLLGVTGDVASAKVQEAEALKAKAAELLLTPVMDVSPTGLKMFPHQVEGVRFLLNVGAWDPKLRGGILADDMGLGKTATAILAAHQKDPDGRKLILCPASLKLNWQKEIGLWLGDKEKLHSQVIKSGKDEIEPGMRWVIVNYDLLTKMEGKIRGWTPKTSIVDEAHYLKNSDAARTKIMVGETVKNEYGKWVKQPGLADSIPMNWLLTGTPIKNRVKELFNMLQVCNHDLGKNFFRFGQKYCDAYQDDLGYWNFDGSSNLDDLGEKIKPIYLKRLKSEVLDLPPKIESTVPVELDSKAIRAYRSGLKELLALHRGGDPYAEMEPDGTKAQSILAQINAMKQATAFAKIPAAIEMIQDTIENDQKIVVFSTYLGVLDELEGKFGEVAVRLDGSLNQEERQAVVDRFQSDPNAKVFLGSLGACKEGLTLTAAREALFVDLPWVPSDYWQASDRIYRIGQTGACNVRSLNADGTFDDDLFSLLQEKMAVIQAFEAGAREGKAADPAALAAANANVCFELARRMLKQARRDERTEKKEGAAAVA